MIVTVASGKGGTGKTTVAVSLALAVSQLNANGEPETNRSQVVLLDCDVEEPNAHLFLNPVIGERKDVGILTPAIDEALCNRCGRCAEVCQYHALAVLADQVLVFPELCHGCGSCTLNCPTRAITEKMRPTGIIEKGHVAGLSFIHGVMNVGEAMSGPIIRAVKKTLQNGRKGDLVIVDAPPGTACPVVECLKGADYALMVTEPTPFGLHDLRMAVEVASDELQIPVGVVINRAGGGDELIEDYCASRNIPILMSIPLDRQIAEAYANGSPLVEAFPEYRGRFFGLYKKMMVEVQQ